MKNYIYTIILVTSLGFISCDVDNTLEEIPAIVVPEVALTAGSADFSNYVAVGASFTAGYTDGGMFKAAQENSFPNILAKKFAMVGGRDFKQPLMNDNIGGLLFDGTVIEDPRLYFDGKGPASLPATPTTETTNVLSGPFNNMGVPGAKSFHLIAPGYGSLANVPLSLANPYFARMATSAATTTLADAAAQNPTFFTLSEIGGNDVLGYATSGGSGINQTGNFDPTTYGNSDITDPNVFAQAFSTIVDALTANGAKGVVANIPYVTSLAHFTTVPYNALNPVGDSDAAKGLASQIPLLNQVYGSLNQVFTFLGEENRKIEFLTDKANPIVIKDENLTDLSAQITGVLNASPTFPAFVQSFGLPAQAAPLVASLLGSIYGQSRPATENDLFVLPSSSIIGEVNTTNAAFLEGQGLSTVLAAQFSAEGVTLPLADKWVLTPEEQNEIKVATDAYNATIKTVADAKGLAFVDFKKLLIDAAANGYAFDDYTMTTSLVTGGMVSLDGIHLTARGYAMMANEILKAIDTTYGSNFTKATNGLAKAGDYPTNYSPSLQ